MQAELFAIKGALAYALSLSQKSIYILTDSLSAIHALQKFPPANNIHLLTTALFRVQQLAEQGKSIHFMWIPSHSGIDQNELNNRAAKDSLRQDYFTVLCPSISHIKKLAKTASFHVSRIQHQFWVRAGSSSSKWYRTVTEYNPITIPRSMKRKDATTLHRLRLGYRCHWEIEERVPRECRYCQTFVEEPLLHYVLACPILENIRAPQFRQPSPHTPLAPSAAICVSQMLQSEDNFDLICTSPPPR